MMSNNGNLLNLEYTNSVLEIANNNKNSVIGMISQKSLTKADDYLYFTPGIQLEDTCDISDQKYTTPKKVMEDGSDILIIGRGIINSSDILDSCKMYQKEAWKYYNK